MPTDKTTYDATSIRAQHRRMLIRLLWREGRLSRAEMARRTGLSRSTVSVITADLLHTNLLRELGSGTSRGGRRPIVLGFDHDARLVVGVDVGASHVSVGLINLNGQVRVWRTQMHDVRNDADGTIALATRLTRDAMEEEPDGAARTIGVGVSMPSPIVKGEPNRLSALLLPAWQNYDITAGFRRALGLPVYIENDANAGALAELRWGAGRRRESLAYIKLATGVGVGTIVNRKLYRGASGVAGEISHLSIDARGPLCVCGQRGCLVLYGGSHAIVSRVEKRLSAEPHSVMNNQPVTPDRIVEAALGGDRLAIEVLQEAGTHLGVGVANMVNLIDPGLVVLGGELTRAGRVLLDPITEALRARVLSVAAVPTDIIMSQLGEQGVALGAGTLVIDHALDNEHVLLTQRTNATPSS